MEKAACQAYICGHKCGMPASDPIHGDSPDINIIAHPFEGITAEEREADVSLLLEAKALLQVINRQIETVERDNDANRYGRINVLEVRSPKGDWVMVPLLAAKAQAIHAIALLKEK